MNQNKENLQKELKQYKRVIEKFNQQPLYEKTEFMQKSFLSICNLIFGFNQNPGLLSLLLTTNEQQVLNPIDQNLQEIIDFLSPSKSKNFFHYIFEYYALENYQFPKHNLPQNSKIHSNKQFFDTFQNSQSNIEDSKLKQDMIHLKTPDYFFLSFLSSLKLIQFSNSHKNLHTIQSLKQDEFLFDFTNNPYLILLNQYLNYFQQKNQQAYFDKILLLIEDYFIQDILNVQNQAIPPPHILEIHYIYIHYCQMSNKCSIKQQKLFYDVFKKLFQSFPKDFKNQRTNLSDIGRVWLKFLTPWKVFENNLIDNLNKKNNESDYASWFYQGQQQMQRLQSDDQRNKNEQFIKLNIIMYTSLFKEFINAFRSYQNITVQDLLFIDQIISFIGNNQDRIFEQNLNKQWLNDCQIGKKLQAQIDIGEYLEWMEAKIQNLNLFNDEELKESLQKVLQNLKLFQYSFVKQNFDKQKEFDPIFLKTKEIITFLQIKVQQTFNISNPFQNQIKYSYSNKQIPISNKIIHHNLDWNSPLTDYENRFLYQFFRMIANQYDRLIHQQQYQQPSLKLRFLAKTSIYQTIFIIMVLYSILKPII